MKTIIKLSRCKGTKPEDYEKRHQENLKLLDDALAIIKGKIIKEV